MVRLLSRLTFETGEARITLADEVMSVFLDDLATMEER